MNFLLYIDCFSAGLVVVRACTVLNEMSVRTKHSIRAAYIMMGLGAFLILIDPLFYNTAPSFSEVLLHAGLATLIFSNRRRTTNLSPSSEKHVAHVACTGSLE